MNEHEIAPEMEMFNWLSINTLIDPLSTYNPDRAMFYLVDGP
jgi:hypothetical protein